METITIGIAVTIVLAAAGAVWRLFAQLRKIEKELTNDYKHDIMRIEEKIDGLKDDIHKVREMIISCPYRIKHGVKDE